LPGLAEHPARKTIIRNTYTFFIFTLSFGY